MRWTTKAIRRLKVLLAPGLLEREMNQELQHHLEEAEREGIARGLSTEEARRQARLAFGGMEQTKELARDARGGRGMFDLTADLRYAVRQAIRSPGHTAAVVGILGTAIVGAGVALALARAYLYRPLPFPQSDRLVSVMPAPSRAPFENFPDLRKVDWKPGAEIFEATGAWDLDGFTVVDPPGSAPEYVDGAWVTPGFFTLRGLQPAIGRPFAPEEYVPASPVALISDGLWRSRFGADSSVVGRTIRLYSTDRPDEVALVTIIGVLPHNEWAQRFSEVLRPLGTPRMFSIARLPAGLTMEDAAARLTLAVRSQLSNADSAWRMSLFSAQDEHVYQIRPVLQMLMLTGVLLLILAQANIGALLVARSSTRGPELAVREALGATRGRLLRQLSVEAALFGGTGLLIGLILIPPAARRTAVWLEAFGGVTVPGGIASVGLDGPVLAGIAVIVLATFIPLALWPAIRVAPHHKAPASSRTTASRGTVRLRRGLTAIQVAVAVTLLVQGVVLARSVREMNRTDLGFDPDRLLKAHVLLPRGEYTDGPARVSVMARILERLKATPGVIAASSVFPHPFRGNDFDPVTCESCADRAAAYATPQTVSSDYFDLMGIPQVEGRRFDNTDLADREPVTVVSEALARRLWPGTSAIGQRIRIGSPEESPWRRVVGVVRDVRKTYSDSLYPDVYLPYAQAPRGYTALMIRTIGNPRGLEREIRGAVAAENPQLALSDVEPMTELLADHRGKTSILASFVGTVATACFGLTMVGLYAVVAYLVRLRRKEFAIRAALGASGSQLGREVIGEAGGILGLGLSAGLLGALAVNLLMRHQLGNLVRIDFANALGVAGLVAAVAVVALLIPARSAAQVDLTSNLRE